MPAALFVAGKEGGDLKGARSRALERNLGLVLVTPVSGTYPPPEPPSSPNHLSDSFTGARMPTGSPCQASSPASHFHCS